MAGDAPIGWMGQRPDTPDMKAAAIAGQDRVADEHLGQLDGDVQRLKRGAAASGYAGRSRLVWRHPEGRLLPLSLAEECPDVPSTAPARILGSFQGVEQWL